MGAANWIERAIACLDLTNLNDDCTKADIEALAKRGQTAFGPVAALCVWPPFVAQARQLALPSQKIATVVAFPSGADDLQTSIATAKAAIADGADEIDMVVPYQRWQAGEANIVRAHVAAMKQEIGPILLKAILETGALRRAEEVEKIAQEAVAGGADFIKTSTGKTPKNATLEASEIMLQVIRAAGRPVGLKPSGGIKSSDDATAYLKQAAKIMGESWVTPTHLRLGASGVLDALLASLSGEGAAAESDGY